MELTKAWHKAANCMFLRDLTSTQPKLDNIVYNVMIDPQSKELYLMELYKSFSFDFKVYGLERKFIDKVLKAYKKTKGNFGVLMNGIKGTGKTITAKILANELGLPVLIVSQNFPGLNDFLADIHQDIVVMIDEYEKAFDGSVTEDDYGFEQKEGSSSLLTIMDGVYKNNHRKMFLLTTNKMWINENMLNRPGRIRYLKLFGDLTYAQITEIIDDCLEYPEYKKEIITFMKPLKIVTADIVKAVVSEVNIFNEPPEVCCRDLNVEFKEEEYDIIMIDKGNESLAEGVPAKQIEQFMNTARWKSASLTINSGEIFANAIKPDIKNMIFTLRDYYTPDGEQIRVKMKKRQPHHSSFLAF